MGVDVSFHIEVRRKNVWRPFIWQTPMEFCSDILKKDEDKEWQTNSCCYWCRYYHFKDFLDDCAKRGLPDDVSPEMKEELSGYEMGNGYFSLSDLNHYYETEEKNMLAHMLQSRDYQMVKQLNRIEKYLKQKPLTKKDNLSFIYYEERTIKEIYEEFMDELWFFQSLVMIIRSFSANAFFYAKDDDIRILYAIS